MFVVCSIRKPKLTQARNQEIHSGMFRSRPIMVYSVILTPTHIAYTEVSTQIA